MTKSKQTRRAVSAEGAAAARSAGGSVRTRPRSAVTEAFLECSTFLEKFVARFLPVRQDIEDVAQEAYLRAYVAERRESIEQPKAFLFRVAKNLALTKLSEKSRQITDYIEEASASVIFETVAAVDDEIEAQQSFGIYCEAVASLPEKCRQVFLLRKVHGLSHKEIGERMDLSISSVEKYLHQGVLACQSHIRRREGSTGPTEPRASRKGKVGP